MNIPVLRSNCGYTFIELLIAISILGLVIAPFLALFSGSFLAINSAGRQSAAVNLCREQMETIKSLGCATLHTAYLEGNSSYLKIEEKVDGFCGFKRTTSVETFKFTCENEPSLKLELLLIEVTVSWMDRAKEKSETLVSFLSCR